MNNATVKIAEWAVLRLALDHVAKATEAMETTVEMAKAAGHPRIARQAEEWVTHIKGMGAGLKEFLVSVRASGHKQRRVDEAIIKMIQKNEEGR